MELIAFSTNIINNIYALCIAEALRESVSVLGKRRNEMGK